MSQTQHTKNQRIFLVFGKAKMSSFLNRVIGNASAAILNEVMMNAMYLPSHFCTKKCLKNIFWRVKRSGKTFLQQSFDTKEKIVRTEDEHKRDSDVQK